jgi:hypothetical protein
MKNNNENKKNLIGEIELKNKVSDIISSIIIDDSLKFVSFIKELQKLTNGHKGKVSINYPLPKNYKAELNKNPIRFYTERAGFILDKLLKLDNDSPTYLATVHNLSQKITRLIAVSE